MAEAGGLGQANRSRLTPGANALIGAHPQTFALPLGLPRRPLRMVYSASAPMLGTPRRPMSNNASSADRPQPNRRAAARPAPPSAPPRSCVIIAPRRHFPDTRSPLACWRAPQLSLAPQRLATRQTTRQLARSRCQSLPMSARPMARSSRPAAPWAPMSARPTDQPQAPRSSCAACGSRWQSCSPGARWSSTRRRKTRYRQLFHCGVGEPNAIMGKFVPHIVGEPAPAVRSRAGRVSEARAGTPKRVLWS
jgi:hypothetical protein